MLLAAFHLFTLLWALVVVNSPRMLLVSRPGVNVSRPRLDGHDRVMLQDMSVRFAR
jgi:hypothetical protein